MGGGEGERHTELGLKDGESSRGLMVKRREKSNKLLIILHQPEKKRIPSTLSLGLKSFPYPDAAS